jgi:hypothetical protein
MWKEKQGGGNRDSPTRTLSCENGGEEGLCLFVGYCGAGEECLEKGSVGGIVAATVFFFHFGCWLVVNN